ncbi:DUF488 domain-containing protein [Fundidesulfovibrio terrae]|uniref:DUF488 domain-containing protein n=1 Tax=Fundidesulfovibrio terrae TaxID=2922866 RepID=UPI001FAFDFE1|nr:DUF488 family protein [Fundidesulfovibrio terrae]
MLAVKRIYDPASPGDGKRYLADRIWPRGVSKGEAALDGWLKELAPSAMLRAWFNHEPDRWEEFKRRYLEELSTSEAARAAAVLREQAARETVTLLFAAKDTQRNNAVALRGFIENGEI